MKQQVSIRLDDKMIDWIDAQAKSQNRTRANYIELALKEKREREVNR